MMAAPSYFEWAEGKPQNTSPNYIVGHARDTVEADPELLEALKRAEGITVAFMTNDDFRIFMRSYK